MNDWLRLYVRIYRYTFSMQTVCTSFVECSFLDLSPFFPSSFTGLISFTTSHVAHIAYICWPCDNMQFMALWSHLFLSLNFLVFNLIWIGVSLRYDACALKSHHSTANTFISKRGCDCIPTLLIQFHPCPCKCNAWECVCGFVWASAADYHSKFDAVASESPKLFDDLAFSHIEGLFSVIKMEHMFQILGPKKSATDVHTIVWPNGLYG